MTCTESGRTRVVRHARPASQCGSSSEEEDDESDPDEHDLDLYELEGDECTRCLNWHPRGGQWTHCRDCQGPLCFDCHGPFPVCVGCTFGGTGGTNAGIIQETAEEARLQRVLLSQEEELLESEFAVAMEALTRYEPDEALRIFSNETRIDLRKSLFESLRCLFSLTSAGMWEAPRIIRSRDILFTTLNDDETFHRLYRPIAESGLQDKILQYFADKNIAMDPTLEEAIADVVRTTIERQSPPPAE